MEGISLINIDSYIIATVLWEAKAQNILTDLKGLAKTLAMRNLAGIHNHKLFKTSPSGSKKLVNDFQADYVNVLHQSIFMYFFD